RAGDGMKRVLVTDTLAESGLAILRQADDIDLDYRPGLKGAELLDAVRQSDALITRSGTAVTPELVNAGDRLRVVGRAGVGLDNVDVEACTARGILVINAPTANTMSATEPTMAMMLARAEVITVHTPLSDETRGMVGAAEIAKMKDGVLALNIARGGIWDERALADALAGGKVAGAAIDVYVKEPLQKDHSLLSLNNV